MLKVDKKFIVYFSFSIMDLGWLELDVMTAGVFNVTGFFLLATNMRHLVTRLPCKMP